MMLKIVSLVGFIGSIASIIGLIIECITFNKETKSLREKIEQLSLTNTTIGNNNQNQILNNSEINNSENNYYGNAKKYMHEFSPNEFEKGEDRHMTLRISYNTHKIDNPCFVDIKVPTKNNSWENFFCRIEIKMDKTVIISGENIEKNCLVTIL